MLQTVGVSGSVWSYMTHMAQPHSYGMAIANYRSVIIQIIDQLKFNVIIWAIFMIRKSIKYSYEPYMVIHSSY